ncbi:MAG TPA: class I SAM-dependent methyltransferase [Bryobacterales bacterium]|nr:class I SAM-dependent methyltransferase [Bryobacterales bacterium]
MNPKLLVVGLAELTGRPLPRIPEPDLVMDDPDKVAAYTRAGREDGVMAPVYLFHCLHLCEVIRPGDTVLDLGCGPATQLAMVARLNPETRFIGVDLSPEMLDRATTYVHEQGLDNVEFILSDVQHIRALEDQSVDVVMSSMALHHLPDVAALDATLGEIDRLLKPGGGLYLADFGRLSSRLGMTYFAYQYADRQPELFTLDYLYSLQAAFSLEEWRQAWRNRLAERGRLSATFLIPFLVTIKSPPRRAIPPEIRQKLAQFHAQMPSWHRRDFNDLCTFLRMGTTPLPLDHQHTGYGSSA